MTFLEKMMLVDRRWIYLAIGLAVILPAIASFDVPVSVSPEVRKIHTFIENIQPGEYLFLAMDYDPTTIGELNPMAEAILRHAFSRDVKVVIVTLAQFGPGMVEQVTSRLAAQYNKTRGVDYVFLGYRPYPALTILAMGVDFRVPFPVDYYGNPLDSLPMMRGIKNFDNVKGVIDLTAGNTADMWLVDGNGRYNFPLAIGITGVMAADYYQYLQSGQLFGIIPGVKGAAEYEELIGTHGEGKTQQAYQVVAHAIIILFIILSNIAYFATRKTKRQIGGAS
ncbi:MAG: hypothetical protein GX409_12790 [candidate division Zixibacteria bacterium]|nr:hypothetical protein [candidate division Zixibacteria bacterium]